MCVSVCVCVCVCVLAGVCMYVHVCVSPKFFLLQAVQYSIGPLSSKPYRRVSSSPSNVYIGVSSHPCL